jgi:hypothetical protein
LSSSGPVTSIGNNFSAAEAGFQVRLFPNPVTAPGVYEIDVKVPGKITAELLSADGRRLKVLYSGKLSAGKHTMVLGTAIDQLPPAHYILSVKNSSATRSIHFILP